MPGSTSSRRAKTSLPAGPKWQPAQRAKLAGSRRPHPLDPPPPPLTREEGWAKLLEAERAEDELCGPVTFQGTSAEQLYAPVRASYAGADPPSKLDPIVERLRGDLLCTHPIQADTSPAFQALVAFWVGTEGAGFVLDVCRAPEPWSYMTSGFRRILVGPPDAHDTRGSGWGRVGNAHLLIEFRRLLFALPEPAFVKARDEVLAWLDNRPPGVPEYLELHETLSMAYGLARDPTLAHSLTQRVLAGELNLNRFGSLLASITDLSMARAVVEKYPLNLGLDVAPVALDVVETFGRDAADIMQAILDVSMQGKPSLKPFYKSRLEAAKKLALTDPRPPTP